ncbi:MAG: tetratricopeptide repeat protein [Microgenomates group bacterium]
MISRATLRNKAIAAAKEANWQEAIELNTLLLSQDQHDIQALNRLGVAHLQLRELDEAKEAFSKTLEIDRTNTIASKHLANLKKNIIVAAPSFTKQHFIEEPGKTKTVELHRLAGKNSLKNVSVGQICTLKPKNRFISIEIDDTYLGALPEDISFRLSKLIKRGNHYSCQVRSCNGTTCSVYIKEEVQSAKNADIHSFPPNKNNLATLNEIDEDFLLEKDIPVEIVDTDNDIEKSYEDVETDALNDD